MRKADWRNSVGFLLNLDDRGSRIRKLDSKNNNNSVHSIEVIFDGMLLVVVIWNRYEKDAEEN